MRDCPNELLPNLHTFRIRWRWTEQARFLHADLEWCPWYELDLPNDVSEKYKQWQERGWKGEREYEIERLCK